MEKAPEFVKKAGKLLRCAWRSFRCR